MFLKSVFQNKIFINTLFFVLLFLSTMSFLFVFFIHDEDFLIPSFGNLNAPLKVNIEANQGVEEKIRFFADGAEIQPLRLYKENSYILYEVKKASVRHICFKPDNGSVLNSIQNIVIVLSKNVYYFSNSDIKNFKKDKDGFYLLPVSDIKYLKSGEYVNDKGKLHKFFTYFLSIFYNTNFYVFPLICLFFTISIYFLNKEKFDFNFTLFKNSSIWWILILGVLLRLSDLNNPFWGDELYTAVIAGGSEQPLKTVFTDPGNPPFFFLLSKIWMGLFGSSEQILRILPLLFSVLTIPALYIFVKRNGNKNLAILASFLFSINLYSLLSAQEYRCYSLCALFSVISSYYLFEIINYDRKKDYIIYFCLVILMVNTHFFQFFILLGHFIWAMVFMKNKKQRLKFFFVNFFAALSFLPYFLITGLKQGLLDENFNKMSLYNVYYTWFMLFVFFSNRIIPALSFVLAGAFGIKPLRTKLLYENKPVLNMFFFSFYTVVSLYVVSYVFSHLVRPVIRNYYFINIIAFIPLLIASILFLPFKNKVLKSIVSLVVLLFSVFCITGRGVYHDRNDVMVIRLEEIMKYSYFDFKNQKNKNAALCVFDFDKYIDFYKKYKIKNEKIISYRFIDTVDEFRQKLEKSKADVAWLMYHKIRAYEFIQEFKDEYNISAVETDKGVILFRMIKK